MSSLVTSVEALQSYSKDKYKEMGEVFTPAKIVREMIAAAKMNWSDKSLKYFDPCAGKGIFVAVLVEEFLLPSQPDFSLEHTLESQVYMAEYQKESAIDIESVFDPESKFKLNLYVGDTRKMPSDFFDIPWEARAAKYPEHCTDSHLARVLNRSTGEPVSYIDEVPQRAPGNGKANAELHY